MRIRIKNSQKKISLSKKRVIYLASQILKIKGIAKAELSILFVGKQRIRRLNKRFRKIDRPTDVLAFSMREGEGALLHPEILGDLVICPELARDYARNYSSTTQREIYRYLIHGILHLLGHDDRSKKCRLLMKSEEEKILKKITADGKAKFGSKL